MQSYSHRCVLALFWVFILFTQAFAQQIRPNYKLLWKISGKDLSKPSYLFGTMHLKDNRVFDFSDSVLVKLAECQAFAMELHPDTVTNAMFAQLVSRRDTGQTFRNKLSKQEYQDLDKRVQQEAGLSLDELQNKSPWLIKILLKRSLNTREDKPTFLDAYLYYLARTEQKQIIGIEHLQEQVQDFDKLSAQHQIDEIKESLQTKEDHSGLEQLVSLYYSGDIDKLYDLFRPYYFANEQEDLHMRRRNLTMASRIDSLIQRKSTFIAVGAAHLPGDQGLVQLLQQRGYTVTLVKPTFTGMAARYTPQTTRDPWVTHTPPEGAYTLELPGKPFLLRVGEMQEMDSYIYSDLGTGLTYYMLNTTFPAKTTPEVQDKLFTSIVENMTHKKESKLLSEQKITLQGYPGRELKLWSAKENNYYTCRMYIRGNSLYMLMAEGNQVSIKLADVERYFASFKLVDYTPTQWKTLTSAAGAFTVRMPSNIKEQVNHVDNEALGKIPLYTFISSDEATGKAFIVTYMAFPANSSLLADSAFLYTVAQNTANEIQTVIQQQENVQLQGFPGLHYSAVSKEKGFTYQSKVFLRGTRPYVVAAITSLEDNHSQEVAAFFDSFTFTDYQKTDWKPYTSRDGLFSVLTPSVPQVDADSSLIPGKSQTAYYQMQDAGSGFPYTVTVYKYSHYYSEDSPDAFFKNMAKEGLSEEDSILSQKAITWEGHPAREILLSTPGTHRVKRVLWVLQGQELLELYALLPPAMAQSEPVNNFFSSFKLLRKSPTETLFTRRTDVLLKDLTASDSTTRQAALAALNWYTFQSTDRDQLHTVLQQNYPDDTVAYRSTRQRLLSSLPALKDPGTVSFIRKLYPALPAQSPVRAVALRVLSVMHTQESLQAFTDLLVSSPPAAKDSTLKWNLFYPIQDSIRQAKVMYPSILQALQHPAYKSSIYWLTVMARDSTILTATDLLAVKAPLLTDVQALMQKRKSLVDEANDKYAYNLMIMADLLGSFPDDTEAVRLLTALLDDPNASVSLKAATILLKNDFVVSPKHLTRLAGQSQTRIALYQALNQVKKTRLFPAKYQKQALFAESELYNAITEDEAEPQQLTLVTKREVTYRGKRGIVYLFKFSYRDEEGQVEWYTGMSGLFSTKKELFSDGMLTYSTYEVFNPKKIDEHIKQYLREFEALAE